MKTLRTLMTLLLVAILCPMAFSFAGEDNPTTKVTKPSDGQLQITCAPELMDLTAEWTAAYSRLYPSVKITLIETTDKQTARSADMLLFSHETVLYMNESKPWNMTIGRDAIVAVMNSNNPFRDEIGKQGISSEEFRKLLTGTDEQDWRTLLNVEQGEPVNLYLIDNMKLNAGLAQFVNSEASLLRGNMVATPAELATAIQKDVHAIGFCRLADISQTTSNELANGIALLPIDKNGNGRLDGFEQIYSDKKAFTHGVWVGKYPSALIQNIYAFSEFKPAGKEELDFLSWIMTDGQALLSDNGYSALPSSQKEENLASLTGTVLATEEAEKDASMPFWLSLVIALIVIGAVMIILPLLLGRKKAYTPAEETPDMPVALNIKSIKSPMGLYYDKTHTWAFMEKNGNVRVGIDDFIQHLTGPLTRIKMMESGDAVRKGEALFTVIRAGKQLNIYSPVSGIITSHNKALAKDASLVNAAPYGDGWVYTLIPTNWVRETEFMFMYSTYDKWLKKEFGRLRDFFATLLKTDELALSPVVLQDGGEIMDNVLADLDPKVWEEFQIKFIDSSR